MVTLTVGDEGFEDEGADQRLWQPGGNHPKSGGFPVTMDNVRSRELNSGRTAPLYLFGLRFDAHRPEAHFRVRRGTVLARSEASAEHLLELVDVVGGELSAHQSQHVIGISPGIVVCLIASTKLCSGFR